MTDETELPAAEELEAQLPPAVKEILEILDEQKGEEIVVLDMRLVSGFTDYMVLCNGRSEPHVKALADAVVKRRRTAQQKPLHVEGRAEGAWVLVDYFDVIVHVFTSGNRDFYQLERLWRDAPLLAWKGEAATGA